MKNLKKVNTIEVKRCFAVAQLVRGQKRKSQHLNDISYVEFVKNLKTAKSCVLAMSEKELDKVVAWKYKKRLKAYNNSAWYVGEVTPNEVGVWRRAGDLPLEWTNGTLEETADKVKYALENNLKSLPKRPRHVIPNMLKTNINKLQNEKYLFPIIFQDGIGTNGRRRLKRRMKGDIDDGCMRSIALTINGVKKIKVYIGYTIN